MPLLFNETFQVETEIHETWRKWVSDFYMPQVLGYGKFLHYRLSRMLSTNENEEYTYTIQFLSPNETTLNLYFNTRMPEMEQAMKDKFGEKALVFRTVMEVEEEGP